jgi:hypothetical protein
LTTIRLRMLIGRELEDRDITTPAAIGQALGMRAAVLAQVDRACSPTRPSHCSSTYQRQRARSCNGVLDRGLSLCYCAIYF